MIDVGDILVLSNDIEYLVANSVERKGEKYYLLINEKDLIDIKFCYEKRCENIIELVEVNEKSLIKKLLLCFTRNIMMTFRN